MATEKILLLCPLRVSTSLTPAASHILAVASPLLLTIRWPSGEKATEVIGAPCPLRVSSSLPLATSHTMTVWSTQPVAIRWPSGENATDPPQSSVLGPL